MDIKEVLEKYEPYNEQEKNDKEMMLNYINTFDDVLTRKNKMCHFTVSNWIVNHDRTKVLMVYHNIYKSWSWTGGHCDGDSDLLHVALKEATEESGIENFKVLSDGLFSIEIAGVDPHIRRGEFVPSHLHLNCTYLLEADDNAELKINEDENSGVKWIDIDKVLDVIDKSEKKMIPIYTKENEKLSKL